MYYCKSWGGCAKKVARKVYLIWCLSSFSFDLYSLPLPLIKKKWRETNELFTIHHRLYIVHAYQQRALLLSHECPDCWVW